MYMVYYFIRIAREIFGRRKLQRILILALVLIAIYFVFTRLGAFAYTGLDGNDDYTDPNSSIFMYYDSYLDDLSIRLMSATGDDVEDLISRLSDSNYYCFYVMYGQSNVDTYADYRHMRVILFNADETFQDTTAYNQWQNMNCQCVYNTHNAQLVYDFDNMTCTRSTNNTQTFYMPKMLINRYNNSLVNVLANKTNTDTNSIVGALNNQTNAINNQTNSINNQTSAIGYQTDVIEDQGQAINDSLSSTDYDDDNVEVDTSVVDDVDNSEYVGLFTTIFSSFNTAINNTGVEYLRIPIPNSNQLLVIPSDLVSRHLGALSTLVSGFWFFVFGFYAFKFVNNLIVKIKDGSILDGYSSSEVITSDMV